MTGSGPDDTNPWPAPAPGALQPPTPPVAPPVPGQVVVTIPTTPPLWTARSGPAGQLELTDLRVEPPDVPMARRHRGRTLLVALLAVVLTALALGTVDWWLQASAASSLLDDIERSEANLTTFTDRIGALVDEAPENPTETEVARLVRDATEAAGAAYATAISQRAAIAGHDGRLPWHQAVDHGREAYLAHLDTWLAYLGEARQRFFFDTGDTFGINASFAAACRVLPDLAPPIDPTSIGERARQVCIDGGLPDDQPAGENI